jgi:sugar phosphate isomerase/epimerase
VTGPASPLARLSFNQATARHWPLPDLVAGCRAAGVPAVGLWREQVAEHGLAVTAALVRDSGLAVSSLCRGGFFAQPGWFERNRRAIDEAAALATPPATPVLVLVSGGLPDGSRDLAGARARVGDALGELVPHARAAGVRLAVEPLHPMYAADRACMNSLAHALDICDRLDPDGARRLGVAVDVYHVWWDPNVLRQIARAGAHRIHAFHVCDWLVPTRDVLLDRGMMGDGVIEIDKLRSAVEAEGFAGPCEVEIFSEAWWSRPIDEVLATVIERYRTAC